MEARSYRDPDYAACSLEVAGTIVSTPSRDRRPPPTGSRFVPVDSRRTGRCQSVARVFVRCAWVPDHAIPDVVHWPSPGLHRTQPGVVYVCHVSSRGRRARKHGPGTSPSTAVLMLSTRRYRYGQWYRRRACGYRASLPGAALSSIRLSFTSKHVSDY